MNAFERAAELFERLVATAPDARAAALAREPDPEVRALVDQMLAGEAAPQAGLETGMPGMGGLVAGALGDERASADDLERPEVKLELADGPYRVLGVLARGGMGVVLRGRDEEIGRPVAIKVLRADARADARLRFIEEAQVAGQLEHPGIVPIYHLGTDDAGRPFFAMKLVEGETLEACLQRRSDPSAERARFLGLYLQVCQTVAYAHARAVIHRDLKPANVMVGAFGEVQVLDWGLAKVLGSEQPGLTGSSASDRERAPETVRTRTDSGSASLSGTVMGTPGYMPPEQALGEVERLDRRSDVFSLGAILCTILTGEPPFPGERRQALADARAGRIGPALERLARCGADPALVTLARRSLSVDPLARPASAGELAAEVERSLSAVEERLHRAELEAEAARARATAERRARRLTVTLTASAAVFFVVLAMVFLWRAREREHDIERLSGEVAAALDVADERFAVARAAPLEDRTPWDATALALASAEGILAGGEAAAPVRQRSLRLRADFEAARALSDAAAAKRTRDRAMVARLEEVRMPTGDGAEPYDYPRMEAGYRQAFTDYGVDVEDEEGSRVRLVASTIAPELAQALDQWALCHRVLSGEVDEVRIAHWQRLLRLAEAADPDPLRKRVRAAMRALDLDELHALAGEAGELAPETNLLLAGGLRVAGDDAASAALLRSAVRRNPGDFWLSLHAALALRALEGKASQEAVAYFQGALGSRPDSRETRHLLGRDLDQLGRTAEARGIFEELVRIAPDYGHARAHLGELIAKLEGWPAARSMLSEAARLAPDDSYAVTWYARMLEETGKPWLALAPMRHAAELERDPEALHRLATTLMRTGNYCEALQVYEEALTFDPDDTKVLYNAGTLARDLWRPQHAEELLRRCTELNPTFPQGHCNLGGALRDLGRFEEALRAYERGDALGRRTSGWSFPSEEWVVVTERESRIADELEAYLAGDLEPGPDAPPIEIAEVALARGWTAAACDGYRRIDELEGELSPQDIDLAILAGLRAGAGDGRDARERTEEERAAWSEQASSWFERERARLMDDFRKDPPGELEAVRSWLDGWRAVPAFEQRCRADGNHLGRLLDDSLGEIQHTLDELDTAP